jgi:hypothetical protein
MADLKISALPAASVALAGTEVLPIVQSSATKQVTVANLTAGRAVATGVLTVTGDATLSTGNLVQGTAAKGINFTANTPATGMTSQLLNQYEQIVAASAACTGAITTAVIWKATRVGNIVTLTLPATTGTASTATNFVYGTPLPATFRPSASIRVLCITIDAGVLLTTPGYIFIDATSGNITVYKDMLGTANFTAATTAGLISQQSFTWSI